MDFSTYGEQAIKTAIYPSKGSGSLVYPALGLCGEAGEIAEKVKKNIRDADGVISSITRDDLIKELGDVLWYLNALAFELDVSLDVIAETNLAKLQSRQARGMLQGSGDDR